MGSRRSAGCLHPPGREGRESNRLHKRVNFVFRPRFLRESNEKNLTKGRAPPAGPRLPACRTAFDLLKVCCDPEKVGAHLEKVAAHLLKVRAHFGKVIAHFARVPADLLKVGSGFQWRLPAPARVKRRPAKMKRLSSAVLFLYSSHMHPIHITAALTSLIAAVVFGLAVHRLKLPANERLVWLAALIALPLQPIAFYFVRVPLDHWLVAQIGAGSHAYAWLVTLYAPLTEEAAKLLPLLVPAILRDIRRENVARYALAIGVGFAIGEMWFVADRVARVPQFAGVPFYQFGGYVNERLMTCVFHSAFVSLSLLGLRRNLALGFAGAAALHWLGNFPISLMNWNVGGLGKANWSIIIQLFIVFYLVVAAAWLWRLAYGFGSLKRMLYGRRKCPTCDSEYDPSFLAINAFDRRYERCPHCKRWQWTMPAVKEPAASGPDVRQ